MEKKFQIDLKRNKARIIISQESNLTVSEEYEIFKDFKGMKIYVGNKVVYLTQENSEVM